MRIATADLRLDRLHVVCPGTCRYLPVDKALRGLCPLRRPREAPRVSRVAVGRIRRPITFSAGCDALARGVDVVPLAEFLTDPRG
jgi:hypothetical protein